MPVHPRVRGTLGLGLKTLQRNGSSPRVRGTPPLLDSVADRPRFIPARAGNTDEQRPRKRPTVHPRACGEHTAWRPLRATGRGSSPRVRGTQTMCACSGLSDGSSPRVRGTLLQKPPARRSPRFIPARAGNTRHPFLGMLHSGSSPRVRGTQPCLVFRHVENRFIPARAGNTPRCCVLRGSAAVHPRACGEHFWPAISTSFRPVHPRACGEHGFTSNAQAAANGSSPRVRGTLELEGQGVEESRFIPARAGNTYREAQPECERTVHPRACGEHPCLRPVLGLSGSSPRVRGTHRLSAAKRIVLGSSPRVRGTQWRGRRSPQRPGSSPRAGNTRCIVAPTT